MPSDVHDPCFKSANSGQLEACFNFVRDLSSGRPAECTGPQDDVWKHTVVRAQLAVLLSYGVRGERLADWLRRTTNKHPTPAQLKELEDLMDGQPWSPPRSLLEELGLVLDAWVALADRPGAPLSSHDQVVLNRVVSGLLARTMEQVASTFPAGKSHECMKLCLDVVNLSFPSPVATRFDAYDHGDNGDSGEITLQVTSRRGTVFKFCVPRYERVELAQVAPSTPA